MIPIRADKTVDWVGGWGGGGGIVSAQSRYACKIEYGRSHLVSLWESFDDDERMRINIPRKARKNKFKKRKLLMEQIGHD